MVKGIKNHIISDYFTVVKGNPLKIIFDILDYRKLTDFIRILK